HLVGACLPPVVQVFLFGVGADRGGDADLPAEAVVAEQPGEAARQVGVQLRDPHPGTREPRRQVDHENTGPMSSPYSSEPASHWPRAAPIICICTNTVAVPVDDWE